MCIYCGSSGFLQCKETGVMQELYKRKELDLF